MHFARPIMIAALSTLSLPAVASAQTGTPTAGGVEDPDKLICRKVEVTGSLIGKRSCKTAAQWRIQADRASSSAQAMIDRGTINSCGGSAQDCSTKTGPGM